MSVEANAAEILERGRTELDRLVDQAIKLIPSHRPARDRLEALSYLAEKASKIVQPSTPCRKGCAHCCHIAVAINSLEAEVIGRYTGRVPRRLPATAADVRDRLDNNVTRFSRKPCTFLGADNECTIYPVRPLPCAVHHSIEASADNCDLVHNAGAKVSEIDLTRLYMASVGIAMSAGATFGDIREFFPAE